MAKIEITYEKAKERHPELIEEIRAKKAKSKSKSKDAPLDECQWFYQYAVMVESANPFDPESMRRDMEERLRVQQLSEDENIAESWENFRVTLRAEKGRGLWNSDALVVEIPPEFERDIRNRIRDQEERRKEVEALSPEERQQQIEELLGELRGQPGFFEIKI